MSTASVTSKGQITIPAAVRDALGLSSGDRVEFVETAKGQFMLIAATRPIQSLKGLIRKPKKPVTLDEMHNAIAKRGAAGR